MKTAACDPKQQIEHFGFYIQSALFLCPGTPPRSPFPTHPPWSFATVQSLVAQGFPAFISFLSPNYFEEKMRKGGSGPEPRPTGERDEGGQLRGREQGRFWWDKGADFGGTVSEYFKLNAIFLN